MFDPGDGHGGDLDEFFAQVTVTVGDVAKDLLETFSRNLACLLVEDELPGCVIVALDTKLGVLAGALSLDIDPNLVRDSHRRSFDTSSGALTSWLSGAEFVPLFEAIIVTVVVVGTVAVRVHR
jgi:hypothetical protein